MKAYVYNKKYGLITYDPQLFVTKTSAQEQMLKDFEKQLTDEKRMTDDIQHTCTMLREHKQANYASNDITLTNNSFAIYNSVFPDNTYTGMIHSTDIDDAAWLKIIRRT